ncbi:hypothetical protein [Natrialbaceae archaeon AArc-T1-2]|uniref:hypothetical protein n=1 Tax=Natrialbaceae archaeon AArc-T1-2 TaxID=3053904 RepID=UPI00255B2B18|nr:hypothetical protein [Natrialbaceae archaeon AArc-T1-2]WIV66528.1 hypothetical protein QQ977_12615 [Natrialbaceae archaeon AArc-T1-2]
MEYAVSRDGTTLVTLHGGSETTARDEAIDQLAATFVDLEDEGEITDWVITDADVAEQPTAPFEPYTIGVAFAVTVVVEADDRAEAMDRGAAAIEEALESAALDGVTYAAGPDVAELE